MKLIFCCFPRRLAALLFFSLLLAAGSAGVVFAQGQGQGKVEAKKPKQEAQYTEIPGNADYVWENTLFGSRKVKRPPNVYVAPAPSAPAPTPQPVAVPAEIPPAASAPTPAPVPSVVTRSSGGTARAPGDSPFRGTVWNYTASSGATAVFEFHANGAARYFDGSQEFPGKWFPVSRNVASYRMNRNPAFQMFFLLADDGATLVPFRPANSGAWKIQGEPVVVNAPARPQPVSPPTAAVQPVAVAPVVAAPVAVAAPMAAAFTPEEKARLIQILGAENVFWFNLRQLARYEFSGETFFLNAPGLRKKGTFKVDSKDSFSLKYMGAAPGGASGGTSGGASGGTNKRTRLAETFEDSVVPTISRVFTLSGKADSFHEGDDVDRGVFRRYILLDPLALESSRDAGSAEAAPVSLAAAEFAKIVKAHAEVHATGFAQIQQRYKDALETVKDPTDVKSMERLEKNREAEIEKLARNSGASLRNSYESVLQRANVIKDQETVRKVSRKLRYLGGASRGAFLGKWRTNTSPGVRLFKLNGAIADERGTTVGHWEPVQQGNRTGIRLNGSGLYWLTDDEQEIINLGNNGIFVRAEN